MRHYFLNIFPLECPVVACEVGREIRGRGLYTARKRSLQDGILYRTERYWSE